MKTKIKKDWLNREKSVEELHNDSLNWLSEIKFILDDIKFLDHLLSSNYVDCLESGLFKKVELSIKKMQDEKQTGITLKKIIIEQEATLSKLIATNSVTSNKNYLETHKKLEKETINFIKKYKELKQNIFKIVENVMQKKEQKKLS